MAFVTMRAIGTPRALRGGPGVSPTLFQEMSLFRNLLLTNMREEAPVNKNPNAKNRGALRRSIKASPWLTNGTLWRTEFSALEYVNFVLRDTRPHEIRPRNPDGVLAIPGPIGVSGGLAAISHLTSGGAPLTLGRKGGRSIFKAPAGHAQLRGDTIFLTVVHHPGTKANHFVERAFTKTMLEQLPGMTKRLQKAMEGDLISFVRFKAS